MLSFDNVSKFILSQVTLHIPQGTCVGIVGATGAGKTTLLVISASKVGIVWNATNIIYYVFAVLGGVLIQGAIFLFLATLSIYLIQTDSLKTLLYGNGRRFAGYPISIFNKVIQACMIYVVPFAFVNYFPSQFLLRKEDMNLYPEIYMYLTPFIGVGLYLLAYGFWR